jgi:hypothetical protein
MSVCLVHFMHKLGLIAQLRAAMMATTVAFAGFLFVDDTDLIALSVSKEDMAEQVVARLKEAVRVWHGGLRATGDALKPEKCSWSLVDFQWVQGKWKYAPIEDVPGAITVPDLQGNLHAITRLDSSEAVKVVGVYQALDGNTRAQASALKAKADAFGAKLKASWLP